MNDTLDSLHQKYSKLQSKAKVQANEITRLNIHLAALKADLADIRAQRDRLAHEKRARDAAEDFKNREDFGVGPGY